MSATLMWEPVKERREALPDALKFVVRDKWGMKTYRIIGETSIDYFQGLEDAGVEGARTVIELILKYGKIRLSLEY